DGRLQLTLTQDERIDMSVSRKVVDASRRMALPPLCQLPLMVGLRAERVPTQRWCYAALPRGQGSTDGKPLRSGAVV
ncbi:hypothetical protein PC129_g22667, partial [Phytophthora cactorum]